MVTGKIELGVWLKMTCFVRCGVTHRRGQDSRRFAYLALIPLLALWEVWTGRLHIRPLSAQPSSPLFFDPFFLALVFAAGFFKIICRPHFDPAELHAGRSQVPLVNMCCMCFIINHQLSPANCLLATDLAQPLRAILPRLLSSLRGYPQNAGQRKDGVEDPDSAIAGDRLILRRCFWCESILSCKA